MSTMIQENLSRRNQAWGGKVTRSVSRQVTVKSTGEIRNLREITISCKKDAHAFEVSKDVIETGDISTDIDTLRISVWDTDAGYEAACKTEPGHTIRVHSGPVAVNNQGFVNTHVVKFEYCSDPKAQYYKMPKLSAKED